MKLARFEVDGEPPPSSRRSGKLPDVRDGGEGVIKDLSRELVQQAMATSDIHNPDGIDGQFAWGIAPSQCLPPRYVMIATEIAYGLVSHRYAVALQRGPDDVGDLA